MLRTAVMTFSPRRLRRTAPRHSAALSLLTVLLWLWVIADPEGSGRLAEAAREIWSPAAERRPALPPETVTGRVTQVRDGDTIVIAGRPVRIANLDCAEAGTRAGDRATDRMRALARTSPVTCALSGRRSYDRAIGTCHLSSGIDIGAILIAEGYCGRWR